jgi:hypothetical protein
LDGILVTGQPDYSVLRYQGMTAAVGQAAWVVAAVAVKEGIPLRDLCVAKVRKELLGQGACSEAPNGSGTE